MLQSQELIDSGLVVEAIAEAIGKFLHLQQLGERLPFLALLGVSLQLFEEGFGRMAVDELVEQAAEDPAVAFVAE